MSMPVKNCCLLILWFLISICSSTQELVTLSKRWSSNFNFIESLSEKRIQSYIAAIRTITENNNYNISNLCKTSLRSIKEGIENRNPDALDCKFNLI